ncbi:MAG: phosphatidate cytidylyltransferase [Mycoplasmataceae bacterium]|nr:phosphatidate cytidylyltransferase [Mycoplasmataceae bacterium]
MKKSMNTRVRSGIFMALYGTILLYVFSLTDQSSDGWSSYIPSDIHRYVSFGFAIFSVLSVAWIMIFVGKELHYCFVGTNNKKQIWFITISMWLIQIIPTMIWMIPTYMNIHMNGRMPVLWFLVFLFSGLLAAAICFPLYIKMVKHGKKNTTFNLIFFPLAVICISLAFGATYYLCIVRYWSTIIIILFAVAGCDIMAYFGGVLFGKHKLAPVISPKKSWEGAIIGSIVSAALIVLFIYASTYIHHSNYNSRDIPFNFFGVQFQSIQDWYEGALWWFLISILAILLTVVTILGDLLFSFVKRRNGIKDFGNSIPGHGGYLDRLDSFTVVTFIFCAVMFVTAVTTAIYNNHKDQNFEGFKLIFPYWEI